MKFEKFVAEVSAMDLRLAEGSAAYTLWRSNKTGSFEEGIIPLGGVKYLVTQVDHVGGRQFRGYGSHFNLQRGSLVVGGPVRNEFVHDLTGVVGGGPTGDAVLYAARRMLQQMAKGPEMSVKDVVLPEVLLEFPAAKLQSPVESQILADQAGMLRRGRANNVVMTSLVAPVTGQVINSWQAEKQPEWTWYAIRAVSGEQRDIVLPTDGHRMFELGDLVKAGEVIFKLTTQTPQGVAEDLVWHDVQQYSKCGMFSRIPLDYVKLLLRQGAVPVNVFEDVSALLGVEGPEIHAEVRQRCKLDKPVAEFDSSERNRAVATAKAVLGGIAVYATNADILASMDGNPILFSGMSVTQNWATCKVADLSVRMPGVFANFNGMLARWEKKYDKMDPAKLPVEKAHAVLEAAEQAARSLGGFNADVAAEVLTAKGGSEHVAGVLHLLAKHGTAKAAEQYVENVHARIDVPPTGATGSGG